MAHGILTLTFNGQLLTSRRPPYTRQYSQLPPTQNGGRSRIFFAYQTISQHFHKKTTVYKLLGKSSRNIENAGNPWATAAQSGFCWEIRRSSTSYSWDAVAPKNITPIVSRPSFGPFGYIQCHTYKGNWRAHLCTRHILGAISSTDLYLGPTCYKLSAIIIQVSTQKPRYSCCMTRVEWNAKLGNKHIVCLMLIDFAITYITANLQ